MTWRWVLVVALLGVGACSGGEDDAPATTPTPLPVTTTTIGPRPIAPVPATLADGSAVVVVATPAGLRGPVIRGANPTVGAPLIEACRRKMADDFAGELAFYGAWASGTGASVAFRAPSGEIGSCDAVDGGTGLAPCTSRPGNTADASKLETPYGLTPCFGTSRDHTYYFAWVRAERGCESLAVIEREVTTLYPVGGLEAVRVNQLVASSQSTAFDVACIVDGQVTSRRSIQQTAAG